MLFPTEETDRLLANLKSGKPSLCAYVFSHPNMVDVARHTSAHVAQPDKTYGFHHCLL